MALVTRDALRWTEANVCQSRVRVFCPVRRHPCRSFGPATYGHDLLMRCGAANVFEDAADRYPVVTLAEVARRWPEPILFPDEPLGRHGSTERMTQCTAWMHQHPAVPALQPSTVRAPCGTPTTAFERSRRIGRSRTPCRLGACLRISEPGPAQSHRARSRRRAPQPRPSVAMTTLRGLPVTDFTAGPIIERQPAAPFWFRPERD